MVNTAYRNRVIEWLNQKDPDFYKGVELLEAAGFKPGVLRVLRKQGPNGPQTKERLRYQMSEYARSMEQNVPVDSDAELHVFNGVEAPTVHEDEGADDKHSIHRAISLMIEGEATYEGNVSKLLKRYSGLYNNRSNAELDLADLPADNDEDTIARRKLLTQVIDDCTDEMERLYPIWQKYTTEGIEPTEEDLSSEGAEPTDDADDEEEVASSSYDGMSKEELQKLRKSVSTKISRAQNMLLYQTEAKGEVENPLTDPYKIAKYKAKIERLEEDLSAIKMAIAKFG